MSGLIQKNKLFYYPWFLFLIAGGIFLLIYSKGSLSLWMNAHHCPAADCFFKYATSMGNGIFIVAVCLLLLFVRYRDAFLASVASIISSLITGILKNIFHASRPSVVLKNAGLHFVSGVPVLQYNSFPSGHTTAAFTLFCMLALLSDKKIIQFVCFLLALIVACSRVYLLEHFLVDVYFGSLIGVITSTLVFYYFTKMKFLNKTGFDNSLIRRRRNA